MVLLQFVVSFLAAVILSLCQSCGEVGWNVKQPIVCRNNSFLFRSLTLSKIKANSVHTVCAKLRSVYAVCIGDEIII